MALTKRQYTDGQTIITAANLNEIQDCIIDIEGSYVPKTRTVAGKALSSNITLAASDVGAVPTSRTINSKALSSNITLAAADVGAVPVSRTVNSKALSSNITLNAADVGAVPTTRTVNSKALSSNITLTATDIGYGSSNVGTKLTDLDSKFEDVSSGSIHNVQSTGIHYVYNAVTDKPTSNGGAYALSMASNGALVGMFTNTDLDIYGIRCINGNWAYRKLTSTILQPNSRVTVPTGSTGVTQTLSGLTGDYVIIAWNFFTAASGGSILSENRPPQTIEWSTTTNQFKLINRGSATVYCQPIFALPARLS